MTAAARRAARAASLPWPRPSMPATSAPSGSTLTTATSPFIGSPDRHRVAIPHSIGRRTACSRTATALLAEARELVAEPPLPHRHRRAGLGIRPQLEVVHEPPRARQAQPEPAPSADVVAQRRLDVADARPVVNGGHDHAVAVAVLERREDDLAPAG